MGYVAGGWCGGGGAVVGWGRGMRVRDLLNYTYASQSRQGLRLGGGMLEFPPRHTGNF